MNEMFSLQMPSIGPCLHYSKRKCHSEDVVPYVGSFPPPPTPSSIRLMKVRDETVAGTRIQIPTSNFLHFVEVLMFWVKECFQPFLGVS